MEFKNIATLRNKYYVMRHGQALSNVKDICSCWREKFRNPLTDLGQQKVAESAQNLKASGKKIDFIFNSPLLRTKQTAKIVGKILGVKPKVDKRLREIGFGKFNGKNLYQMWASFKHEADRIDHGADGGESYVAIVKRMTSVVEGLEKKHQGKSILLISHEGPSFLLQGWFKGLSIRETIANSPVGERIHKAEIRELN